MKLASRGSSAWTAPVAISTTRPNGSGMMRKGTKLRAIQEVHLWGEDHNRGEVPLALKSDDWTAVRELDAHRGRASLSAINADNRSQRLHPERYLLHATTPEGNTSDYSRSPSHLYAGHIMGGGCCHSIRAGEPASGADSALG